MSQLSLFRTRVMLRGIRGTVVDSWPALLDGHDAMVQFDGPNEWVGPPWGMRDVAGCLLLVRLANCEVIP